MAAARWAGERVWNGGSGEIFACPCCGHIGRFHASGRSMGRRVHARCPRCRALERHRLQHLVLQDVFDQRLVHAGSVLHVAPEPSMRALIEPMFGTYVGVDINPRPQCVRADLRALAFADESFDMVYASHVLEHIDDDLTALGEIRRVLRPGGAAILPVPIVAERTVEYPEPSPTEHGHVRAPGLDYYDRYRSFFARIVMRSSQDYDPVYQLYVYEDRTRYPNRTAPRRPSMPGERHADYVPICFV
jgi:SAM-dependent methyltransferase